MNMRDRNAKKYARECEKLKEEVLKRRREISDRHRNDSPPKGLGISPEFEELGEVSKYFSKELNKIQQKYGIK